MSEFAVSTEFEETLAGKIVWLQTLPFIYDALEVSKYLIESGVVADPAEVERLSDIEKAQGATIRELEDENTELNNELGTAVQVLKLERDTLRADVDRLRARLAAVKAAFKDGMYNLCDCGYMTTHKIEVALAEGVDCDV